MDAHYASLVTKKPLLMDGLNIGMGENMADKIPWCKFWHSCLSDPDLEELELHQWARWARLIIFLRGHGDNGKMRLVPPARALQTCLRVQSFDDLLSVIKLFKNMVILVTDEQPSHEPLHESKKLYMLVCRNWYKYQEESSKQRVKKWRDKRTVTPHVSRNGVEKSRLDLTSKATSSALRGAARLGATPPRLPATRDTSTKDEHEEALEMNMEDLEIAEANRAWKKPEPERNGKRYEEAKDDELCGPPKGMWDMVKKGMK